MTRSEQIEFFHHVDAFLRGVDELKDLVVRVETLIRELPQVHFDDDLPR